MTPTNQTQGERDTPLTDAEYERIHFNCPLVGDGADWRPRYFKMTEFARSLETQLIEAQKDVARLDWLEWSERREEAELKKSGCTDFLVWYPWMKTHWGKTYRDAIDSAMKECPKPANEQAKP